MKKNFNSFLRYTWHTINYMFKVHKSVSFGTLYNSDTMTKAKIMNIFIIL